MTGLQRLCPNLTVASSAVFFPVLFGASSLADRPSIARLTVGTLLGMILVVMNAPISDLKNRLRQTSALAGRIRLAGVSR